jgi:outer membrane receptor for ferrienterochelin and colicin
MSPVTRKSPHTILWCFILLMSGIIVFPLHAADQNLDPEKLYDMDLYQLMELEVTTATRTKVKLKQSPSAVYVITERDIRQRGYRTLSDSASH